MDRMVIRGGRPLTGSLVISGAKNAALPLMAASLLSDSTLVLENVPRVADIASMGNLLAELGVELAEVTPSDGPCGKTLTLSAAGLKDVTAPYDLVRKMRASVLVLGPLVARMGHARVSLPGGCAIGTRPIDLHLKALAQLGAEIELAQGYVDARAAARSRRRRYHLSRGDRHRHRKRADGRRSRRGRDDPAQCGARAGSCRPGARAWWRWARGSKASAPTPSASTASRSSAAPGTAYCPTGSRPAPTRSRRRSPAARSSCGAPG